METQDNTFKVRTYGFSELAMLYLPNLSKQSAANRFRRWLQIPQLLERLKEIGYCKGTKLFTPRQVKAITDHLGNP